MALFDLRLYVQSKQLTSCQDGLLKPRCSWASLPLAAYQYKVSILLPVTDNMLFLNQGKREYFLGLSNHARLDIRRFGSGIRIHPKVRIVSHRIYETMFAWYM